MCVEAAIARPVHGVPDSDDMVRAHPKQKRESERWLGTSMSRLDNGKGTGAGQKNGGSGMVQMGMHVEEEWMAGPVQRGWN